MEHILIYFLSKLYWILIYCFTVAGQVSLSDSLFSDSRQWVCEEVDSVDTVSVDVDASNNVSSVGMFCHSNSSISFCFYQRFYEQVISLTEVSQKLPGCVTEGVFECPERHRVRLRFCSD